MATRGTLIKGLKIASVYSAGLFAGGVVFMRAVDTPTRFSMAKELPDGHKTAMRHFRFMHNHVEKMQVPLIIAAMTGSTSVFFLSKGAPKRSYWLASSAVLGLILPLTRAHINPRYRVPMCQNTEEIASKGPEHVHDMFTGWSKGHSIRALFGATGFFIMVTALV